MIDMAVRVDDVFDRFVRDQPLRLGDDREPARLALSGLDDGDVIFEVDGDRGVAAREEVHAVAFSPSGRMLATAGSDETVKLWDVATARVLRVLQAHGDAVLWAAFSPDGKRLATASADETVKVWDAESGALLCAFKEHWDRVQCVAFAADGRE